MPITKESDLENILNKLESILTYKGPKSKYVDEVREVLKCSYRLFSGWKGRLGPLLTGAYSEDGFWSLFEEFLCECNNGSWSQMSRHLAEIADYKKILFYSVQQLLSAGSDLDLVAEIMRSVTDPSSPKKIKGLSPFILSGISFAFDEDNFMILDKPVLEYFGISNYEQALSEYKTIIDTSKSYSTEFNLSMWYINKAYGILSHGSELGLKKLCGKCRSKKSSPLVYSFI